MNRLKNILLAGTLVPALVLPPMATSWAQAPGGFERGGPGGGGAGGARGGEGGPHGGGAGGGGTGGPRGGGAGGGGMGGPGARGGGEGGARGAGGAGGLGGGAAARPERAAPRAERPEGGAGGGAGGRAERAPAAGRGGAEPGEGRGARQERQAPAAAERTREPAAERRAPAAAERTAPASRAAPAERAGAGGREPTERATERTKAGRGAETPAERASERANAGGRGAETPAARAAERPGAAGRATTPPVERAGERPSPGGRGAETPAERAAERPHSGTRGAETPAERAAGRPGATGTGAAPGARGGERPGATGQTGERGERPGAPGTPPGAAAGREGAPGQPAGRFNDPASPQGGGFRNGDNSRGNAAAGRGQDNRGFDNRGGDRGDRGDRRGGISPGGAAAIGAAAGFAGGFLAATGARDLDGIRRDRREDIEDGRTYIREPGRTIVDEGGGRAYIVHDENDRFRDLGYDVRREQRGDDFIDTIDRPGGEQILTFTTRDGRMLRRVRRYRDGREVVLIDNAYNGGIRSYADDVVDLPPPRFDIPRDRYAVDYAGADEGAIYEALSAPPVQAPPRRYTLDQIRYSPDIRRYVRSVDINTINFASGSWVVPASATGKLRALGQAIKRAVGQNPNSVFLVEGFTDATGNPNDNLSLSDRRAQSVAAILSKDFGVPPENLTTQGYGQQNPKVNTSGPSAENRRVVVQNITQLMADNGGNAPPPR